VTAGAQLRIVAGHELVTFQEVRVVPGVEQPVGRLESTFRKFGTHAPASIGEVASRAFARRVTTRGFGHLVAVEATTHAGQLIARRQLDRVDLAVALSTADVPPAVRLMRELEMRRRKALTGDAVPMFGLVADVAVAALADEIGRETLHRVELAMVALVAAITHRRFR
jgi:hypothetical protein